MFTWKKGMHAGVSFVLAATLLAGCSGGTTNNTPPANPGNTGAATGNQENGEQEPVTIKMFAGLYNEIPDMNNEYWTEWERMTNSKLDVEWVPSGDLNAKLDLMLASGDLPEVVAYQFNNRPTFLRAIKNGAFWDLTDFLGDMSDYPNLRDNLAEDALKYLSVDGRVYGLPRSRSRIDGGIKIRQDWLEQLDLPVPTTFDEYEETLKQIVDADLDGNGRRDTVGLLYVNDPFSAFQVGFGLFDPTYNEEGGLITPRLTPQGIEMTAWFRGLYEQGLMSQEFAVMKESQAEELFKTNRAASYGRPIWWDYDFEEAMRMSGQEDAKILNLHLQGPAGDAVALETGVAGGFYISKKVPEEKVWRLLDYFEMTASQEVSDFSYYGIEGVHYTEEEGQKILTDQGAKEVNTTSKGVGVLTYNKYGKVISASGDKAYNDAKIAEVGHFDEIGKISPNTYTATEAWINTWPKYESEFNNMYTKAIVGQITMEEFEAHVDMLNNQPDIKEAYLTMAEAYENFHNQ